MENGKWKMENGKWNIRNRKYNIKNNINKNTTYKRQIKIKKPLAC
jgi:hypothetical protein